MHSFCKLIFLMLSSLENSGDDSTNVKQTFCKRNRSSRGLSVRVLVEILKVCTIVKNIDLFLIFPRPKKILAKAGATSNHLMELDFRQNFFEENKIQHLWNINTCVKHIHRHCNLRHFCSVREAVYQIFSIIYSVIYQLTEFPSILSCIVFVENINNQLGMVMIESKNDSFTQYIIVIYA